MTVSSEENNLKASLPTQAWPAQAWPLWWLKVVLFLGCAVAVIFGLWPEVDLTLSRLFYRPGAGFWVDDWTLVESMRMALWRLSIVMALAAFGVTLFGRSEGWLGAPKRVWTYVAALYLMGPGLLVDRILKQYWGRARPSTVSDFGGTAEFTPFYRISDQCPSNCSFVSGEGAGAMTFAIALMVLLPFWRNTLSHGECRLAQVLSGLVLALTALQRVAAGGHFVSDVLAAYILMAGMAFGLQKLFVVSANPTWV
ncbi:MAG: phosphatase PAP2 family protein [Paracoccaceae bacterium]|jgi:lipid A 4'-phosphatase